MKIKDGRADVESKLLEALKKHAKRVRDEGLTDLRSYPSGVLITYAELCDLAGRPVIPRGAGRYLTSLAQSARSSREPPPDCLVVKKNTNRPGVEYGSLDTWPSDVVKALRHLSS